MNNNLESIKNKQIISLKDTEIIKEELIKEKTFNIKREEKPKAIIVIGLNEQRLENTVHIDKNVFMNYCPKAVFISDCPNHYIKIDDYNGFNDALIEKSIKNQFSFVYTFSKKDFLENNKIINLIKNLSNYSIEIIANNLNDKDKNVTNKIIELYNYAHSIEMKFIDNSTINFKVKSEEKIYNKVKH